MILFETAHESAAIPIAHLSYASTKPSFIIESITTPSPILYPYLAFANKYGAFDILSIPPATTILLSAQRTPVGSFGGTLSTLTSTQLGSTAIAAAIQKAGVNVNDVSEVIMGCVLTSGVGSKVCK